MDFIPADAWGWWRDEAPSTLLALTLCPSLFRDAARRLGRSTRVVHLKPWLHRRDERLASLARLALRDADEFDPGAMAFTDAIASAMAVRILNLGLEAPENNARVQPLDGRRLKAVLGYIDAHLDQTLTLDRLAGLAGLRRSHFAAAFRLATQHSPRQFIIRRRVEAARKLLADGAGSISEVAFQTGFAHQSHLSRALRKITGLTPREAAAGSHAPVEQAALSLGGGVSRPWVPDSARPGEGTVQQFCVDHPRGSATVGRFGSSPAAPARPHTPNLLR